MKIKSKLFLIFISIGYASASFAQLDFKAAVDKKIKEAKANNFTFETGSVVNFHLNTNISSVDVQPTPALAMPALSIDLAVSATLNTDVALARIYFVNDSALYQPPLYVTATKTIQIEYPLSYYPVVKDMLYNAFYDPDAQKRKLDIFWADDGNGKSSAGFFQE